MLSHVPPSFSPVTLEQPTVLIVEDEPISRRAMSVLLSASGYRTQAYRTAEEALQVLAAGDRPRFALVDLDLPGMSGLDFIRLLETDYAFIMPVLVTATDADTLAVRLRNRSVAYLRKPVNFPMLLRLLDEQSHPGQGTVPSAYPSIQSAGMTGR